MNSTNKKAQRTHLQVTDWVEERWSLSLDKKSQCWGFEIPGQVGATSVNKDEWDNQALGIPPALSERICGIMPMPRLPSLVNIEHVARIVNVLARSSNLRGRDRLGGISAVP